MTLHQRLVKDSCLFRVHVIKFIIPIIVSRLSPICFHGGDYYDDTLYSECGLWKNKLVTKAVREIHEELQYAILREMIRCIHLLSSRDCTMHHM
mmetsp:Transcript_49051/g.104313  ORF Transcript_49051/g.104313 Transcript_49051/m.104313 type:complete len:94 (+) Transcript_49051:132-413(+)